MIYGYETMMLPFAWTGKGIEVAAAPNMIPNTFAWDVGLSLMELTAVVIVSLAHIQVRQAGVWGPSSSLGVIRTRFSHLL